MGAIPTKGHFVLEPEVVLTVILPPLLYAAARQVPFVDFRRNLRVIGFLAVVLVVVSAVLVGVAVSLIWALAIALTGFCCGYSRPPLRSYPGRAADFPECGFRRWRRRGGRNGKFDVMVSARSRPCGI